MEERDWYLRQLQSNTSAKKSKHRNSSPDSMAEESTTSQENPPATNSKVSSFLSSIKSASKATDANPRTQRTSSVSSDLESRRSISKQTTDSQGQTQPPSPSPLLRRTSSVSKKSVSSRPPTVSTDLESKRSTTSKQLPDREEFNELRRGIKQLAEEFEAESKQIKSMLQESLGMSAEDQASSAAREQALSVLAEDELSDAMTLLGNSLEYLVRGARQEKRDLLTALAGGPLPPGGWPGEQSLQVPTPTPPQPPGDYPSSLEMSELLRSIGLLATELRAQNDRISQAFQGMSIAGSISTSLPPPPPSAAAADLPTPSPVAAGPQELPLASPFYGLQQGIVSLTRLIQEDSQRLSSLLPETAGAAAAAAATDPSLMAPAPAEDMPPLVLGFGSPLQQEVMATGASVMSRLVELSSVYADRAGGAEAVVASTPLVEAVVEVTRFVDTLSRRVHELKQHKSNERRAHFAKGMRAAMDQLAAQVRDVSDSAALLEHDRFQECIEQQQALVAKLTIPDPALLAVLQQVKDATRRLATGVIEMKERQDLLLEKYSHPQSIPFDELGVSRTLAFNGRERHPTSVMTDVHGLGEETMLKSLHDLRESVAYLGREVQEVDMKKRHPPSKEPVVPPTDPNVLKALSALRESVQSIHPRMKGGNSSSSSSSSDMLKIK